MYLPHIKEAAIKLRKEGYSYSHISLKLHIAKSTLSLWLGKVPFSPNAFSKESSTRGQKQVILGKRVDKLQSLKKAYEYAEKVTNSMTDRELFFLGMGIYIGEGSKTSNSPRIVNSDPRIISFVIAWFKSHFGLSNNNFHIRLHIYPDMNKEDIISYWENETGLNRNLFQECYIDTRTKKSLKKKGILPYGTAHVSVVSNGNKDLGVLLHRKILATIDFVLKKRG